MSPTRYFALRSIFAGMVSKGSRSIRLRSTKLNGDGGVIVRARLRDGLLAKASLLRSDEVLVVDGSEVTVSAASGDFDNVAALGDCEEDCLRYACTCRMRFWRLLSLAM